LICSDPDAPRGVWHHWVIYNLPPEVAALPAGLPQKAELQTPVAARQGRNSWARDNVGYRGPMPPPGDGPHRYHFTVYALDTHIELAPGQADAAALEQAMQGHVLAQGRLTGTYERK
jgi:Raf kinase inhibitor-like YbhB/YbcL family protein